MIEFRFRTELDPVAVYAAVVSTAVFIFALVQWWRTGPRLVGHASANMKFHPDNSDGTYVSMTVYNRGTRRTKITSLGLATYSSRWARIRRKANWKAFIPNLLHTQLPVLLEPGDYVIASMVQNAEIVEKSKKELLVIEVYYTDHSHPFELRLQPIEEKPIARRPDDRT